MGGGRVPRLKVRELGAGTDMASSSSRDTIFKVVGILAGVAIILGGKSCLSGRTGPQAVKAEVALTGAAEILDAVAKKRTGVMIEHWGTVTREVAIDSSEDTLQKFIVTLENGHMLLFAHETAIAPRVPLVVGDRIEFKGRFDWNHIGGLVHRTHHDPQMVLEDGWIKHNGKIYR